MKSKIAVACVTLNIFFTICFCIYYNKKVDPEIYMKGIDYSCYDKGYAVYRTEKLLKLDPDGFVFCLNRGI